MLTQISHPLHIYLPLHNAPPALLTRKLQHRPPGSGDCPLSPYTVLAASLGGGAGGAVPSAQTSFCPTTGTQPPGSAMLTEELATLLRGVRMGSRSGPRWQHQWAKGNGPSRSALAFTSAPSQGGFCPAARAGASRKASYKGPIGPREPEPSGTISSLFV